MASAVSVLLVDDHPVVRSGLRALLSSLDGIEVCGEAGTGSDAVKEALLLRPDVIFMDVSMPLGDGIDATRRICTSLPNTAVIVLTMFEDEETVSNALRAGARGYLLKGADQQQIERAVHAVAVGQLVLGTDVVHPLVRQASPWELTPREREILGAVACGDGNAAIAGRLGLAPKTVSNHISALFAKMQVGTRAEAIVLARDQGFGRRS